MIDNGCYVILEDFGWGLRSREAGTRGLKPPNFKQKIHKMITLCKSPPNSKYAPPSLYINQPQETEKKKLFCNNKEPELSPMYELLSMSI